MFGFLLGVCTVVPGAKFLVRKFLKPDSAYGLLFNLWFAVRDEERVKAIQCVANSLDRIVPKLYPFIGLVLLRDKFFVDRTACLSSVEKDEILLSALVKIRWKKNFMYLLDSYLIYKLSYEPRGSAFVYGDFLDELKTALLKKGVSPEFLGELDQYRENDDLELSDTPIEEIDLRN